MPDAEPDPEGAQPASPAQDDDAETPQPRREARTPGKPRTRERDRDKERERALIRRTAAKSQELAALGGDARNLLAGILAVAPTTYDLTVAVMTASAKDYQSAVDALTVIDADVVEAAVEAAALGRPRVKAVWQLVARAGHLAAEMPASDVKAAVALVRALRDGIDTVAFRAQVEDALALIKR